MRALSHAIRSCARRLTPFCAAVGVVLAGDARADVSADEVARVLTQPAVSAGETVDDLVEFVSARVAVVEPPADALDLLRQQSELRARLSAFLFRGFEGWRERPLRLRRVGVLAEVDGVVVEGAAYEGLPGIEVPIWIYRPPGEGRWPAVLSFVGHGKRGARDADEIARGVELARRGVVAVVAEWPGAGLLRDDSDSLNHRHLTAFDLRGLHGAAPLIVSALRALDVVVALDEVDAGRVGLAGLSGGGWQALWVAALDERPVAVNVVAGFTGGRERARTIRDTGDFEQVPAGFFATLDYGHLLQLVAPRALLLTANVDDECCFRPETAWPALLPVADAAWSPFGERVFTHLNTDPGTHNFGADNRAALFTFVARALQNVPFARDLPESRARPSREALAFALTPPSTFQELARRAARSAPPAASSLDAVVGARDVAVGAAVSERVGDAVVERVALGAAGAPRGSAWIFRPARATAAPRVLVADDIAGLAADVAAGVSAGSVVVVVAPTLLHGFEEQGWRYALLVQGVSAPLLGHQIGQLRAAAAIVDGATLEGRGARAGFIVDVAGRAGGPWASVASKGAVTLRRLLDGRTKAQRVPEVFAFGLATVLDAAQPRGTQR